MRQKNQQIIHQHVPFVLKMLKNNFPKEMWQAFNWEVEALQLGFTTFGRIKEFNIEEKVLNKKGETNIYNLKWENFVEIMWNQTTWEQNIVLKLRLNFVFCHDSVRFGWIRPRFACFCWNQLFGNVN